MDVNGSSPVQVGTIRPICHQAPIFDKFCRVVYRWKPALYRKACELCSLKKEDGTRQHENRLSTPLLCLAKCRLNIVGSAHVYVLKLQAERPCGEFRLTEDLCVTVKGGGPEYGYAREAGNYFFQNLQSLSS